MPYPSHSMQYEWPLLSRASWDRCRTRKQEVAGELVRGLGNDLNDELLGDDLAPGGQALIERIGLVQFS